MIFDAKSLNMEWRKGEIPGSTYGLSDKGWVDKGWVYQFSELLNKAWAKTNYLCWIQKEWCISIQPRGH